MSHTLRRPILACAAGGLANAALAAARKPPAVSVKASSRCFISLLGATPRKSKHGFGSTPPSPNIPHNHRPLFTRTPPSTTTTSTTSAASVKISPSSFSTSYSVSSSSLHTRLFTTKTMATKEYALLCLENPLLGTYLFFFFFFFTPTLCFISPSSSDIIRGVFGVFPFLSSSFSYFSL